MSVEFHGRSGCTVKGDGQANSQGDRTYFGTGRDPSKGLHLRRPGYYHQNDRLR